jgi:RNA polymerase sigma factor (sigma-70 family)
LLRFLATAILHRVNNLARAVLRPDRQVAPRDQSVAGLTLEQTGAVTAAVRAEQRLHLLAAVDALDTIDRDVLLLRGVEQRALQTVAELLGISIDAVSMRFTRALGRLRAHLPAALVADLAS